MDTAVGFLLAILKQSVYQNHVNFISDAKNELQILENELGELQYVLRRYEMHKMYNHWERAIRELVYDIEDTIDTCITRMEAKKTSHFKRIFVTSPTNLAKSIKTIRRYSVEPMFRNLININLEYPSVAETSDTTVAEARESRQKMTENIVGFEQETGEFIDFLNAESNKLEIAFIVGMAGLGKTTLTWKIFNDPGIVYEFPVRIWVDVSDDLNMKNILLTILKEFTNNPSDEPEEVLIQMVKNYLMDKKFLIVMDNIWNKMAWDKVKEIFPLGNNNGRVLVTTRHMDVAEHFSTRPPHYLRILTESESWQLLQYEVYGKLNAVPQELQYVGQVIAKDCNGHPLSLVVIGGILVEKISRAGRNNLAIEKEWEDISTSVKYHLVDGDKKKLLLSITSLSYEKIPYDLRNCFLYLGMFPEGGDIPVNELLRLWIAEGFILEREGESLEKIALDNLKELINLNLVMIKEKKPNGEPKLCGIHGSIREVAKSEAKYENLNFFQEITRCYGGFEPRNNIDKLRRLCIHSYVLDFFKHTHKVPRSRSFLCFDRSPELLQLTDMACVTDGFSLLRVYNAKYIKFPKFPQKFVQLLHLRYLTLVVQQCTSLPEAISDLWNLQTLIVDVSSCTLDIKADVWRMRNLRHLKTKASIILKKDGRGEGGDNLQTLSRLSPESCTNDVFKKAKNLITLGIQGELNKLVSSECLGNLERLHKLKLVNKVPNEFASENQFRCMFDSQSLPPNLKILVLSGTCMQWTKMSTLSKFKLLEVLKLKNNAFVGNSWEAASIFHHLEHLHIESSTELVYWKASGHPFPKLRFLILDDCEKLIEAPFSICENLEVLVMKRVTKDLISLSEAIAEDKKKQGVPFNLNIAF